MMDMASQLDSVYICHSHQVPRAFAILWTASSQLKAIWWAPFFGVFEVMGLVPRTKILRRCFNIIQPFHIRFRHVTMYHRSQPGVSRNPETLNRIWTNILLHKKTILNLLQIIMGTVWHGTTSIKRELSIESASVFSTS